MIPDLVIFSPITGARHPTRELIPWLGWVRRLCHPYLKHSKRMDMNLMKQRKTKKQGLTTLYRLMATYSILQQTSRSSSRMKAFMESVAVVLMLSVIFMIVWVVSLWVM